MAATAATAAETAEEGLRPRLALLPARLLGMNPNGRVKAT